MGIGLLPSTYCDAQIASGELVRLLPDWSSPEIFVHAVYPTRRFLPAKLQVFLEDLKAWKSPLWISVAITTAAAAAVEGSRPAGGGPDSSTSTGDLLCPRHVDWRCRLNVSNARIAAVRRGCAILRGRLRAHSGGNPETGRDFSLDVVGYSRLAGADEDRTLARLRALRSDLVDPVVSVHHGRIVKRTGDGSLIEFRSVVDAVRCAIEVQSAMVERNAGVSPEKRIEFRIGVHLGDVVEESDGDLMGDGVNIAARLEGVAEPGAICLSEDAYRQVRARLAIWQSAIVAQRTSRTSPSRYGSIRARPT